MRPHLFVSGDFTLHAGGRSAWKIECDALTSGDWKTLARMLSEILPPFGAVEGVPRGGLPLAEALQQYANPCPCSFSHPAHDYCNGTPGPRPTLIVDDVCTTGKSLERQRAGRQTGLSETDVIGAVVFARGPCPSWVTPLFQMAGKRNDDAGEVTA